MNFFRKVTLKAVQHDLGALEKRLDRLRRKEVRSGVRAGVRGREYDRDLHFDDAATLMGIAAELRGAASEIETLIKS